MKEQNIINNAMVGPRDPLLPKLLEDIRNAKEIHLLVSFLMESGVSLLMQTLEDKAKEGIPISIITGTYLHVTEPGALFMIKDHLGDAVDLRIYDDNSLSFHPKAYFIDSIDEHIVYVGSSNMSRSALIKGVEWNYRLSKDNDENAYQAFHNEFTNIASERSVEATLELLREYAKDYVKPAFIRAKTHATPAPRGVSPRGVQHEALLELRLAREEGVRKGLVIAATGVGKTFLAAFDSKPFKKILFVVHREEILKQAHDSFQLIHPKKSIGYLTGGRKDADQDIILASVQTLSRASRMKETFSPDWFDYIVVDEFHHAAAATYRKVLDYFEPEFLLGLTATPYRMDNEDILALCEDNLIYQVDIRSAINRDILCPFRYYGVYDETDYSTIAYRNGKYVEKDLEERFLDSLNRDELILSNYQKHAGRRTLGFCSSVAYAEHLAELFNDKGIAACAVHSGVESDVTLERSKALKSLADEEINIIFTVDMFNEGVDIPSLDTVMFLRPTESYTIFMQQLGRGLRKHLDKEALTVLDFIGNYKKAYYKPILLAGKLPDKKNTGNGYDAYQVKETAMPYGCRVNMDFRVLDLFAEQAKCDQFSSRLEAEYHRLKEMHGRRPSRKEIYLGSDLKTSQFLQKGYLAFLNSIGEPLSEWELGILDTPIEEFLNKMEKTSMAKSYKIPIYRSSMQRGGRVMRNELVQDFFEYYEDVRIHKLDLLPKTREKWSMSQAQSTAYQNPVKFLSTGRDQRFFEHNTATGEFSFADIVLDQMNDEMLKHLEDITDYKELAYFARNRDKS
jgi:superfamily II DNA or RNA helicase